jgi:hypothetical protein
VLRAAVRSVIGTAGGSHVVGDDRLSRWAVGEFFAGEGIKPVKRFMPAERLKAVEGLKAAERLKAASG